MVGRFEAALDRAQGGDVLLDLSACDFLDLGGLALLVGLHRRLQARGARLLLSDADGQVARMLSFAEPIAEG